MSQIIKPLTSSGPIPGNVATTYDANTGSATPSGNILNVLGINGATTTASGNTINISPGFATSQFISSTVLKSGAVPIFTNTPVTVTSITLPAGNWTISAIAEISSTNPNVDIADVDISISTVNNTLTGNYGLSDFNEILGSGNQAYNTSIPGYQVSIVTPTTYYMVLEAQFSPLGAVAFGTLSAIGQLASGGGGVTFPITVAQGGTGLTSTTANQLLYSSANSVIAGLTTANNGVLVTSASGVPSILAGSGTTGNILQSNSGASPSFSTATYPSITNINQILYSSSNNVVAGLATANNGVLTTGASGIPVITALASNGQLIIGSGSGAPSSATLTAGTGTTITNGANSITVNTVGAGLTWTAVTGSTQAMSVNNGYIANRAGTVTFTLPTTSAVGDVVAVTGINTATGWSITYTTNQQIFMGTSSCTITSGSLSSINIRDTVFLVCVTANLTWNVFSSVGNLTVA